MIKINWNNVAKVLKFIATVITSVLGTIAVQSCAPGFGIPMIEGYFLSLPLLSR